ncbi:MAG: CHASE3 domain-containing protein [Candidatus Rokuibacteriota bacterium]
MAVLLAIAAASYRSVASLAETGQWIGHTHEVLAAIDAVVAVTTTAETSARGYALTGEERFLETYQSDARGAEAALATLRRMTADNPGQQRRGDGLEPLVREHLARLADTVAIRRDQSGAAAAERVRAGSSTGLAESIQVAVEEMRAAERTLLAARVGATGARAARTRWIILSGSLAVVMVTVVSGLLISREIVRRRAIDRGLRASEARYRLLVDRNLAAIARTRRDGAVLECNEAMVRLLGCASREEVLAMTASQFYADPADREHLVSEFAPVGGVVDREVRFRRKNGAVIWVSMTFLEYEDEGQPSFEAVMLDITDRKATSARIEELNATLARQNRDLAAANQELDAFSYSISHDLRAPLRAMQGFSDALLEDYRERLDATGHDYAKRIVAASRQMDALIQDLLAYSRLGRAEISLDPLSLETVVDEACGGLEMELKECEGEIAIERPLGRVLAHRAVLGQIVTNLLANAIKFTRPDTPPRVRVRSERAGGRVRLWVEDDGIGIAPEHRERIVRAFERLHGVQQYPGTGIGLAIVQKGATRLGGQAGVESEPGAGSRFWVDLAEAAA